MIVRRVRARRARPGGARAARQSRLSPLRRAGAALKAANGAHGAELAELSGLLHAGLVKREPEDLSRKVAEPAHALTPPRHKVRHTSARRRRARTHSHTPGTHVSTALVVRCAEHRARDALAEPARARSGRQCNPCPPSASPTSATTDHPYTFSGLHILIIVNVIRSNRQ